jgi:hypothetical protein
LHDKLLSSYAFNFNSRRYMSDEDLEKHRERFPKGTGHFLVSWQPSFEVWRPADNAQKENGWNSTQETRV